MNYTEKTLQSGKIVHLRPLTWEEYWDVTQTQIQYSEDVTAKKDIGLETMRYTREKPLQYCVQDWEQLKSELTLPDVLEIEAITKEISKAPVAEGNL